MRGAIELFRELSLRQILGLELAWASSLGLVFAVVTWYGERALQLSSTQTVTYSLTLRWQLGWGQILLLTFVAAAPFLLWLALRSRTRSRR